MPVCLLSLHPTRQKKNCVCSQFELFHHFEYCFFVLSVYGYPVPHIAVIYNDGLVFDISLEDDISPSKNLLIKLPDERNKKDDRGKRYAYQDQFGTLYFFSSTISRPVTQLQQKSRFHTITHNGHNLFNDRRVKLYSGAQLGNKFWIWGLAYHSDQHITECMFSYAS